MKFLGCVGVYGNCCEDNRYDRKIVIMFLCYIIGVDYLKLDFCWLCYEIWLVN